MAAHPVRLRVRVPTRKGPRVMYVRAFASEDISMIRSFLMEHGCWVEYLNDDDQTISVIESEDEPTLWAGLIAWAHAHFRGRWWPFPASRLPILPKL